MSSAVATNPLALTDCGERAESSEQFEPARYSLRKKLRAHLFGRPQIWLGGDRRLGSPVVIKRFDFTVAGQEAEFERDLSLLTPAFPHVPHLIDVFHDLTSGMRCIVREYVAGELLEERVGRLDFKTAIEMTVQLASVLHDLHAYRPNGITVGGVSLQDFVIAESGDIWLLDSPSPKQIVFDSAGERIRDDVRQAAVLALQLIFGIDPLNNTDIERKLTLLPSELAEVFEKASHPDPDQRYASAQWFARALIEAAQQIGERLNTWNENNASSEPPLAEPTFRPLILGESPAAYSLMTGAAHKQMPSLKWATLAHRAMLLRDVRRDPTRLSSLDTIDCIHYAHQQDAALQVLNRPEMASGAILADEVGLGKTIEALMICQEMRARGQADSILIIAPPAGTTQWLMEARRRIRRNANERGFRLYSRAEDASYPLLIVSSATIRHERRLASLIEARKDDLLIVDEAHQCCGQSGAPGGLSTLGRAVNRMRRKRTLLLTATPLGNRLKDIVTLADLIRPGIVGTCEQLGAGISGIRGGDKSLSQDAIRVIRAKLGSVLVRHRRIDHPNLATPAVKCEALRFPSINVDVIQEKVRRAVELITGRMADERVVVFTRSPGLRELFVRALAEKSPSRRVISFQANRRQSRELETQFNEYSNAVIVANDVVAEGMNWQAARCMIHLDLPTTPLAWEQRTGRIFRLGQVASELHVVHLIAAGTGEEKVFNLYDRDLGLFSLPIGEAGAVLDCLKNPAMRNLETPIASLLRGDVNERRVKELSEALRDARARYNRHSKDIVALDNLLFGGS